MTVILRTVCFSALADEVTENEESGQLSLSLSYSVQKNNVNIDVFSNQVSFCALLFTLIYDCEAFCLENVRIGINNAEFDLSYNDENGKTVFLIDGTENFVPNDDPIVSFIFSINENISGKFDFLLLPTANASACRISDGEIEYLTAAGDDLQVCIEDNTKYCYFDILYPEFCDEDLTLKGIMCGDVGFSVGFEVTFLYLDGRDPIVFIVSRAIAPSDAKRIKNDRLDFYVTLPASHENVYCIKVLPFSCFRNYRVFSPESYYYFLK
jgi:hypothetical protein